MLLKATEPVEKKEIGRDNLAKHYLEDRYSFVYELDLSINKNLSKKSIGKHASVQPNSN